MNRKCKKCSKHNCEINKSKSPHGENSNIITKNDIFPKKYNHVEGYYTCNGCGEKLRAEEAKAWENNGLVYTFCSKCYPKEDMMSMFKKAKVVTSKFLVLKDKLNKAISDNRGYDTSSMRAQGTSETSCNIYELQKAFGELCELLHELTVGK